MGRSHTLIQKWEHKPLLIGDLLLHFVPSSPCVEEQPRNKRCADSSDGFLHVQTSSELLQELW